MCIVKKCDVFFSFSLAWMYLCVPGLITTPSFLFLFLLNQSNHFHIIPHVPSLYLSSVGHHPDAKDSLFSRSRSSSVTSIERESREAISSFHFSESFPRKTDSSPSPSLWLGTTQGTVLVLSLSLPPTGDQRLQQPVGVSSCGKCDC